MSSRSAGDGTPTSSSLSNRPGLLRAGSSVAGLLVAAMTSTPFPVGAAISVSSVVTSLMDAPAEVACPFRDPLDPI